MSSLKTASLTLSLLIILAFAISAGVPGLLNYQGKLSDAQGDAVADGTYSINFSIWTDMVAGESKWSETQPNVMVADGVFSALLGSIVPLSDTVFADPNRYLQIEVNGEAITPRIQLTSVGYAQRIGTIDGAGGGTITDSLVIVSSAGGLAFGRSMKDVEATKSTIAMSVSSEGFSSISLFEPVDSKAALAAGEGKRLEIRQDGIVLFGATGQDTTLVMQQNGDIRSVGQITMGQNSSDGTNTTVLGFENTADGDSSTIGGGSANIAQGTISVIAGGHGNSALSEGSTISGGAFNEVNGQYATVGGGSYNSADGDYSVIPGGNQNSTTGLHSYAAGHRAQALHDGSFVWADETEDDFASTQPDQFLVRAGAGVGINTNDPVGMLDVTGAEGDYSVNLPSSAISAPEILDEPGIASERSAAAFVLPKGAASMSQLLQVEINVPAPGYIVLRAGGNLAATGTSKQNQVVAQISESGSGTVESAYAVRVGAGDYDTPSSTHYFTVASERIYAKDSGTYIFYFEAMAHPDNDGGATSTIINPFLTATYFPTSYGGVTSIVSGAAASQYRASEYVGGGDVVGSTVNAESQDYKVDLRELEVRALKARLEAERAERDLLEAQMR